MTDPTASLPHACDVAVIGAGVGGLTAAAILSDAGLDVAVFEANAGPGGSLGTFTRNGFVFDPAVQWLNQCRTSGFVNRIFGLLSGDFPRCRPLQRLVRYKGDTFDYLLTAAPGALEARLIQDFPRDARGIHAFFRDAERVGRHWENLCGHIRDAETMSVREKHRHGLYMAANALPLLRYAVGSVERKLRRYFRSPDARKLFCREHNLLSMLVPIGWAYSGDFQAPPIGGSHAIITWLGRQIERRSGQIHLNRRVTRVLLDAGRAAGVELEGGHVVRAKHVLAAGDLHNLYAELLPPEATPRRLREALRTADLYASSFCVFLGLDCDPAQLGFGEELLYVMCEDVPRAEQSRDDPDKMALTVIAPSVRDASLAPPGKGTLIIQCPASMAAHGTWRTETDGSRGEAYRAAKQQVADTLIDRVERCAAPGLRKHIEVLDIATPLTYRRYTGNLHGSIMGTKPSARNIRAHLARYRTPVDGLLLSGHWAEYGGGVPMAIKAGANAALLVLKDAGSGAYEALKHALDGRAPRSLILGIPRALYYFLHPGLWETFFRELGLTVVVSSPTTRATVERAALISESEHCLPVKILDAHIAELVGISDLIFVPRILSSVAGCIACPKLGALPDSAAAQFGHVTAVLTVDVDTAHGPLEEALRALGRTLKADEAVLRGAIKAALRALRAEHAAQRDAAPAPGARRFLLLGHPYNLRDECLCGPILRKLEALGAPVERIVYDADRLDGGPLQWDACGVQYEALQHLDPATCAGVLQLSSFNCGCDSIAGEIFRALLREKRIPYMTLVLDEHAAQAGVDTRLEAFVDSTRWT